MHHATEWTITIYLDEHEHQTHARARLTTGDNEITGVGIARCNPREPDVPEIGDELAAARALNDLAHNLFEATIGDIEANTQREATLRP